MNTKATPELSYFRLKLTAYLRDHQPELVDEATLVSSRSDAALTTYCDAVVQGFSHPEAESIASNVLFEGLHFSKYDTPLIALCRQSNFGNHFHAPALLVLVRCSLCYPALRALISTAFFQIKKWLSLREIATFSFMPFFSPIVERLGSALSLLHHSST